MKLPAVIDTFVQGFAACRNLTHPCEMGRLGPLWVVRDGPRKDPRKERNREYVALDTPAKEVIKHIRRDEPRGFALCVVHGGMDRDAELEAEFKAHNLRYHFGEPFFVKRLPPTPRGPSPMPVRRVKTAEAAQRVAKAARFRQLHEAEVTSDKAAARLFAAFKGDAPVGWVTSVRTAKTRSWVENLYVLKPYRGKGVGSSLMRAMLRDDARRGIRYSVLTASRAGAVIYKRMGYEQVGMLQLFRPIRGKW